ncbi:MAG: DUF542 domain-containing protein [Kofleriaceae bacterium]|nr:DUF542 domain-containing protein [Kofleriaceae bacterium]MCL4226875.1 DUF542 domain-containing protein [Myxococcales bacterium]
MLNPSRSVASVVLDHSECAEVFSRHRIDYCCRGERSIEVAVRERGLEVEHVMAELGEAIAARRERPPSPAALATPALIEHIVHRHHAYLRRVLPFLRPLAAKVARVHGDHQPTLREVDALVAELAETLLDHLDEEEQALFPALAADDGAPAAAGPWLAAMRDEHLAVAALLERLRRAAGDYIPPPWACGSFRTLFGELEALERDVFTHVHLENHVLGPRFAPGT